MMGANMNKQPVKYYLDSRRRFVVENYNWAKAFSNFFPGIAGKWGVPMWIYYVSRGQGICSMGVRDKDHAILEFYSFNKALQLVGQQGFRTFIKIGGELYEPFQRTNKIRIRQKMIVSSEELEINDVNPELEVETNALYFPLVGEAVPALVRELRIKNLRKRPVKLELIDGLPRVLPYGMGQDHAKFTAWHIEAMMNVEQLDGIPLFRLKQTPADVAQVGEITGGNFYLALQGGKILKDHFIVDPAVIFGEPETYDRPWVFEEKSIQNLSRMKQVKENRTPCAFTAVSLNLPAGGEITLYSLVGGVHDEKKLRSLLKSLKKKRFIRRKREENWGIIEKIKNHAFTASSSPEFDQYCQQTFLDNVIRGGMPLVFDTAGGKSPFYLYSRQNADLERDYHALVLEPTYLSQGDGHYRSVLQNRRKDVWFFPEVGDLNIVAFLNLLQTDGYNPLVAASLTYTAEDTPRLRKWLRSIAGDKKLFHELLKMVGRPFTPGEFIMKLEEGNGRDPRVYEKILKKLLLFCRQNDVGALHEGFWVDHWTYNLDLLENFLGVYPERLEEILIGRKIYIFYDNPDIVLPRDKKHVLMGDRVRQYGAVVRDPEKLRMIKSRSEYPARVRTKHGRGRIYKTNLLAKLLSIAANRIATLDPEGIGMEMEADKPGWCDSLNGLPGLLGSSLCETVELERLCRLLRESLDKIETGRNASIILYEELYEFMTGLSRVMEKRLNSKSGEKSLIYWEESNRLKERYREKTKMGISGRERKIASAKVKIFLDNCLKLLGEIFKPQNREKILHRNGVPYTYFINEVEKYEPIWKDRRKKVPLTDPSGHPLVRAKKFHRRPVALFLEGPVHLLKVHRELNKQIYDGIKGSQLYDRKLKMYRCCGSLEKEPFEIGRIRAYAPGWLEDGSIYLHMEYKWLLEVLRSGLHQEFYRDIKTALIPFLNPEMYGRSILEGGSFIVSSAFPDEKLHGRGFQPRLSGVTSEMLHIWTIMVAGENPFFLDEKGKLALKLRPVLPSWLFTKKKATHRYHDGEGKPKEIVIPKNAFVFKFLGRALVVYHNSKRKDTFGRDGAKITSYRLKYNDGKEKTVAGDVLKTSLARDVREGRVKQIDAVLS
jgi:hypothetical protein